MNRYVVLVVIGVLTFVYRGSAQTLGQAVDNTNLVWTTGGSNNISWFAQSTTGAFDGAHMAISGVISANQATWIQTTVTGPGTLGFWWNVFSETNGDFLRFYIDGNKMDEISGGPNPWRYGGYAISAGVHTLMWQYEKNGSVNAAPDQGYLDEVTYVTNAPMPLGQALNTCGVNWVPGTNSNPPYWQGQTDVTHDGVAAAESGAVYGTGSVPGYSSIDTPANGATNVSFWWKVSSSSNNAWLEFYIDSSRKAGICGEVNWKSNFFTIPTGAQTLEWRYAKSNNLAIGSDRGWLDQVIVKPPQHASAYSIAPTPGMISNQFQLSVAGEMGCTCRVDFSTNLANWTPLTTFVTTNLSNVVIDSGAGNSPQRFYRAASP